MADDWRGEIVFVSGEEGLEFLPEEELGLTSGSPGTVLDDVETDGRPESAVLEFLSEEELVNSAYPTEAAIDPKSGGLTLEPRQMRRTADTATVELDCVDDPAVDEFGSEERPLACLIPVAVHVVRAPWTTLRGAHTGLAVAIASAILSIYLLIAPWNSAPLPDDDNRPDAASGIGAPFRTQSPLLPLQTAEPPLRRGDSLLAHPLRLPPSDDRRPGDVVGLAPSRPSAPAALVH